jgi:hypothetical protein
MKFTEATKCHWNPGESPQQRQEIIRYGTGFQNEAAVVTLLKFPAAKPARIGVCRMN